MRQWTVCWCVRACLLALVTLGRQRCSADSSLYTSPRTLWDDHMHVAARLCPITGARQQLHAWVHTFPATGMTTRPDSGGSSKAMHWHIIATGLQIMCSHERVLGLLERCGKSGWSCLCAHTRPWLMHRRDPPVCSMHFRLLHAVASCFT